MPAIKRGAVRRVKREPAAVAKEAGVHPLTISFVVRLSTLSYFLCRTNLSIATKTDFCMRFDTTCKVGLAAVKKMAGNI